MEPRSRLYLLIPLLGVALAAQARVFMTQRQALASAFPAGTTVVRQTHFLTPAQTAAAKRESGVDFADRMIARYVGMAGERTIGYAYFDSHRVRTLPETVMILVTPDGQIDRVDILSFDEPPEYQPKPRWLEQLHDRKLDDDLSMKRSIRPISGASLSGRAIVNASRKVLALHRAIGEK